MIGQVELFAGPLALWTWPHLVAHQQVLHFIDNSSAWAALIKGYSPKLDSAQLVSAYWKSAALAFADIYVERVESKSNIADGPSRLSFAEVEQLGFVWTDPVFDSSLLGPPRAV
eukprot:6193343-Alexandrium_andersonii.AAC.1